jgi:ribosomal protein L3 glutamine methyltransferase
VYVGLGGRRPNTIVSNPPYVSKADMQRLPREHRAEPARALRAARGGLAIVERILAGARRRLTARGILVVEAGSSAALLRDRHRDLPFTWLEFERGGDEVFLLRAAELRR